MPSPRSADQVRDRLIYVVEDDPSIGRMERSALTKVGHRVELFDSGKAFLERFDEVRPDLVILDLMLPDIPGEKLLETLRSKDENDRIPIVIVSAKNMISDRVGNLDMGADDYIEKPFDILEFLARINARLRKSGNPDKISAGDFVLNPSARKVTFKGQEIKLTSSEYTLLQHLVENAGKAVPRADLVQRLWGGKKDLETRTVDIHITNIRHKIKDPDGQVIKTIYGVGYMIEGGD